MMMTGVSFDLSWKRWNSHLFAVTEIWEESLEAKVFDMVKGGCPFSIGADTGFPIALSHWFSDLFHL